MIFFLFQFVEMFMPHAYLCRMGGLLMCVTPDPDTSVFGVGVRRQISLFHSLRFVCHIVYFFLCFASVLEGFWVPLKKCF